MANQPPSRTASSEHSVWIWIILAAVLLVSALLALGVLMLVNSNQQTQAAIAADYASAVPIR